VVSRSGAHIIFGFLSDDEEGDGENDGEGELASIVPVRSDLLTGSLRVLYLGWLLRVQAGDVGEDVAEPAVPAGLAQLSGAESALVDFLRIDLDLIVAATQSRGGKAAKHRTKNGSFIDVEVTSSAATFRRRPASMDCILDVTYRRKTEAQARYLDPEVFTF
jgi:hypothetical protein